MPTNYTLDDYTAGEVSSSPFTFGHMVYLELAHRRDNPATFTENRIGLYANEVGISTTKTIPSFPIPFSGLIMGESTTLALDLGMAAKTISVQGVILEQNLTKQFSDGVTRSKTLTAYELSQLIHSYVDSSFKQIDQNLNTLFILYPGRVDGDWNNYSGITDNTPIEKLPLIPWTWHNRKHDYSNTLINVIPDKFAGDPFSATYPSPISDSDQTNVIGTVGFISSFTTTMSGAEHPSIQFQLEFQEATVVGS
tara:strand:- start:1468 stop:2223 length:756 start_codon:yes stop_codon:yes gene_type:complete